MKIGTFARQNNVSIDTIRHYMNLELLIPQRINSQFDFDERCQKDFDDIIYLKKLDFNLAEIKNIFTIKLLGRMTLFQKNDYYRGIFKNKLDYVKAQMEKLAEDRNVLEEEIRRLDSTADPLCYSTGIDLSWLRLLQCTACGGNPVLKEAAVSDNMVMDGILKCSCGCEYEIRNGILQAGPILQQEEQLPDIISYIQNTDSEYLNQIYKTMEWNYANIDFGEFENRVVLEPGCGSGFFLRRIYDALPDSTLYIAVDKDIDRIRFLKGILEKAEHKKNILFICCDFSNIPLRDNTVDIVCDYTGTSNYSFEHGDFLLKILERYFKSSVMLLSSYIIFKNFSRDSSVDPVYRRNFQTSNIKTQLKELGFVPEAEYVSDTVARGGIYENYFKSSEKILTYCFMGKRSG